MNKDKLSKLEDIREENFIWIMRNKIENEDLAEMQDPF